MAKSRSDYVKIFRSLPYAYLITAENTIRRGWTSRSTLSEFLGKKVKILNWHSGIREAIRVELTSSSFKRVHVHYKDLKPISKDDIKKEEHIFHYNPEELAS